VKDDDRIDYSLLPLAKDEPRKRRKGREKRVSGKVVATARAECVTRDGRCRLVRDFDVRDAARALFGECRGHGQWAHFGERKRFKTRGMPPEHRHNREWSLMLCYKHHNDYDHGRLEIEALTTHVCDGRLRFSSDAGSVEESAA